MIHTPEEFERAWNAPNTLHITAQTLLVMPGPDGLRMILHHGGQTLAMEFTQAEARDLRGMMG